MKLSQELTNRLKEPLPPEAVRPHPTKPYLSSINSIYVTERLNQVFGVGGWKIAVEIIDAKVDMVLVKLVFTVPEFDIHLEQFGGNDNKDKGDALKGATTDALTKIGSYLGIGQDVWKDTQKSHNGANSTLKVNSDTGEVIPPKAAKTETVRFTDDQIMEMVESGYKLIKQGEKEKDDGKGGTFQSKWYLIEGKFGRGFVNETIMNGMENMKK